VQQVLGSMTEVHLVLPFHVMLELSSGTELFVDVNDQRIFIRCDLETIESFKQHVERALLAHLPIGDTKH
jgi:hypothetical protein